MSPTQKSFDAKVVSVEKNGFQAVASTPSIDHDNESLQLGCFNPLPATIPVHADHVISVEHIVARARPYYDGNRLMLDGRWASTEKAETVRALVNEGFVTDMSVFFCDAEKKMVNGVRTVVKGTLKSVDFVSIACNRDARVLSSRSLGGDLALMAVKKELLQLEIALDEMTLADARKSIAEAKAFLRSLDRRR